MMPLNPSLRLTPHGALWSSARVRWALALFGALAYSAQATPPEALDAVEWTTVSMAIEAPEAIRPGSGVAFFVLQRRLIEVVPGPQALVDVAKMAEGVVALESTGTIKLRLPPGNFAMVWAPDARVDDATGAVVADMEGTTAQVMLGAIARPGPDAQLSGQPGDEAALARRSAARREAIARSSATRLPVIVDGNRLNTGGANTASLPYVAFNRYVRPPAVDFGLWTPAKTKDGTVTIRLKDPDGRPATRAALRIRGHNGDLLDPLPTGRFALAGSREPAQTTPGVFHFRDVFPQPYQAVLIAAPPPPPAALAPGAAASSTKNGAPKPTERPTDRAIANPDFVFDGQPLELEMAIQAVRAEDRPE